MRIVRHEDRWNVVSPALGCQGCCLRTLAVRFGYRVGELCAELRCSERYLRTVFIRDIGLAPKEWMRQERMGLARRLLEEGNEPLAVAEELGFSCLNSFRREFRMAYGSSPVQWSPARVG